MFVRSQEYPMTVVLKLTCAVCIYTEYKNNCSCCVSQYQDLHCSEPWFHGRMKEGRLMAERLIHDYCTETRGRDGTFLVRESDTYVTDFTLSFWYSNPFLNIKARNQKLKDCSFCLIHSSRNVSPNKVANEGVAELKPPVHMTWYTEDSLQCHRIQMFFLQTWPNVCFSQPHLEDHWDETSWLYLCGLEMGYSFSISFSPHC